MFVRKVTTLLKPNSISKFSRLMEEEVPRCASKTGSRTNLPSLTRARMVLQDSVCGTRHRHLRGCEFNLS